MAFTCGLHERPATVGISGHWGREELDVEPDGHVEKFDTWSVNLDFDMPLTSKLVLKGELWQAENIDHYLGGIGHGVNDTPMEEREVAAAGGWFALALGPWGRWWFNAGAGMDEPDEDDIEEGTRSKNTVYWGNVLYDLSTSVQLALELSRWKTEYVGLEDGEATRIQGAFTYRF